VRRTADEMRGMAPLNSLQTIEDYEKHVARWEENRTQLKTLLRSRYSTYLGEPYTDSDASLMRMASDLLERPVANTPANVELYSRWVGVKSSVSALNHAEEVLARHLFNLKKARDAGDAVTKAAFKKTGDAVVDGIGYSIPGNAEQWQFLFKPIPGHEGSSIWGPVTHEIGHNRWDEALTRADRDEYTKLYLGDFDAGRLISPSEYGIKESNKRQWQPGTEHFAECFQMWRAYKVTGDARYLQLVPKWAIVFFEKVG